MIGGFITVVATDVFQAILMIITLFVFPLILLYIIITNDISLTNTLYSAGVQYYNITSDKNMIDSFLLIICGISWAFGYTGQPQLLTRIMAMRDKNEIIRSRWIALLWTLLAYSGALVIGIFGFIVVKNNILDIKNIAIIEHDCEKIMPVLVNFFVNPFIAGFLLSGSISAMMSTASSEIIVSSSSLSEDIYNNISKKKMDGKNLLTINKFLTLLVGLVAIILAILVKDTVYGLVSYAWSGIGSSFGPVVILLLFWGKLSRYGVMASFITGTLSTVLWKIYMVPITGITERLTSFVFAFIMAIVFSLIFPENKHRLNN